MKPPHKSMWPATAWTIATIPCRLIKMIAVIPVAVWVFRSDLLGRDGPLRWLVWLIIGALIHLCAILLNWLLDRSIDLSLLNPWTYSEFGWFLTVVWYIGWLLAWINE